MSITAPTRSLPRASTLCRNCLSSFLRSQPRPTNHKRDASNTSRQSIGNISAQKSDDNAQSIPRWAATPSAMRAPYRIRPRNDNDEYPCNEDPQLLDDMYSRFLGKESIDWLDEGIKWLAVTHKSFDHGRRGYNERLAFMGRRMMHLQTSLALLDRGLEGEKAKERLGKVDVYGRVPYLDPALDGIGNVSIFQRTQILDDRRLAQLGERKGLTEIIRWKPRQIRDLKTSGIDDVLAEAVFAIVGAVALQQGGRVANQVIRERILKQLGVI